MILVNGEQISSFVFNGGECHVRLPIYLNSPLVIIEAYLYNSDEVMKLFLTIDALRQINPQILIHLTIPYLPYARQDRVCNPGEAFSLKMFAEMIISLSPICLTIYDPHSKMVDKVFSKINYTVVTLKGIIIKYAKQLDIKNKILVSPDQGSEKKVRDIAFTLGIRAVFAVKSRDTLTGEITSTSIPDVLDPSKKYLILDDICDGGRTFLELAKKMHAQGVKRENISLYVTHGIFAKGFDDMANYIGEFFCYHRFPKYIVPYYNLTVLNKENKI